MGNVRAYDPQLPPATEVDLQKFPLKMATVSKDDTKKGAEKFKVSLANEFRCLYMNDPVHAPKWKELVLDFDKKWLVNQHLMSTC